MSAKANVDNRVAMGCRLSLGRSMNLWKNADLEVHLMRTMRLVGPHIDRISREVAYALDNRSFARHGFTAEVPEERRLGHRDAVATSLAVVPCSPPGGEQVDLTGQSVACLGAGRGRLTLPLSCAIGMGIAAWTISREVPATDVLRNT